jgi:hypothetical protein
MVTDMAHFGGISVEGELGVLGSLETGMGEAEDGHGAEGKLSHDQLLTDPDEAVKFVRETKVDALAIAMGTSHGAYKFTLKPDGSVLAMNVIEEIHRKLPNTHLVMHGSSSVPIELQEIINKYGGHAEVLMLGEDAGLRGSTHIPFADMDNSRVAELLDTFLRKAGLDGYQGARPRGHWVWDN